MQAQGSRPTTVMVVEDEATTADVLATALADDGHRVLVARDGQSALQLAQRALPDAIVLDLRLPKVDGWQIIRWCRADPRTTSIPIIVVSAACDAQQDADIAPLVFVEKPFDLDVLLALVEDAVSPSTTSAVG